MRVRNLCRLCGGGRGMERIEAGSVGPDRRLTLEWLERNLVASGCLG